MRLNAMAASRRRPWCGARCACAASGRARHRIDAARSSGDRTRASRLRLSTSDADRHAAPRWIARLTAVAELCSRTSCRSRSRDRARCSSTRLRAPALHARRPATALLLIALGSGRRRSAARVGMAGLDRRSRGVGRDAGRRHGRCDRLRNACACATRGARVRSCLDRPCRRCRARIRGHRRFALDSLASRSSVRG